MAKQLPKVFYGLHFYPGPAEYKEPGKEPYRILINEATIREMDKSFAGKPVYVRHVEEVNLDKLQIESDGYVVESFYNASDGNHWVKFLIVSDKGQEAVRAGWKLSNAYLPKKFATGGIWNGIEYQKEVTEAEYEHLAIVNDPRYQASIILTPEEFKEYNQNHLLELKKVANSKTVKTMFKFFKKTEVEASQDLSEVSVKLKNGKEVTIAQLINAADQESDPEVKKTEKMKENEEDKAEKGEDKAPPAKDVKASPEEKEKQGDKDATKDAAPQMANEDHHVQMGDKTMSVKDLKARHDRMQDCMNTLSEMATKKNDSQMDGGEKDAAAAKSADKTQTNADKDGGEKEAESQEKVADKTAKNSKHFDSLQNAHLAPVKEEAQAFLDGLERGKSRYGSGL